ncbi:MAG: O-antigen ligase family protein [Anaerolineae bacterium]|nr:O-antigen ligase family protein [Anaerolineae bacterium]MDW8071713.1 O-antigen ligase family protein [Anaerolineae bacterium]
MQSSKPFGLQILFFLAILYATFIGGTFYTDFWLSLRVFHHLAVGALLLGWLICRLRRGEGLPRTPLDVPILAYTVALFLTALVGIHPRFSLEQLWTPFTWVLLFYLLVDLGRRGYNPLVLRALYMSAAVVCVVSGAELVSWYFGLPLLPQFVQGWPTIGSGQLIPPILHRLSLALNGSTPLSAYMALLIPPALAIMLTTPTRDHRRAMALWLVVALSVEALSMSRGGLLALAVSLPLTALSCWLARRRAAMEAKPRGDDGCVRPFSKPLTRRRWLVWGIGLAAVALIGVVLAPLWLRSTFVGRAGSTNFRLTLWQVAWQTLQEHPVTGVGPYNFGRSLLRRNDASLPRRQVMTAHNWYLNTAAETGLMGLATSGWLLGSVGLALRRRWQEVATSSQRMRIGAVGAALAGFAAQNLVDTFTATPVVLPVLILTAYALTTPVSEQMRVHAAIHPLRILSRRVDLARAAAWAVLGGVVLYALGLLWWDGAQYHFQRSVHLFQEGRWEEAIAAAAYARHMDGAMAIYTFQLAHILSAAEAQPDVAHIASRASQAADLYRAALSAEPVHGRQSANLAATLWRRGDREGALAALQAAVAADADPLWALNLGSFYQQMGDLARALDAYGRALAAAPEWAASPFWEADEVRRTHWAEIVRRAEGVLPGDRPITLWRLQLALARREWDAVREYATALRDDPDVGCLARSALARVHLARGELADAVQAAEQAIHADVACGEAYLIRGQVHAARGEESAAERDWRIALFLGRPRAAYHLGQMAETRGDRDAAARWYRDALPVLALPTDVEVVLYNRHVAFGLLPPLFSIGIGPEEAAPYWALGDLYQAQGDYAAARQLYRLLLIQDPFLSEAQRRLEALEGMWCN